MGVTKTLVLLKNILCHDWRWEGECLFLEEGFSFLELGKVGCLEFLSAIVFHCYRLGEHCAK